MSNGLRHGRVACHEIRAVDFLEVEVWKIRNQPRNVAAGSLYLDWNRDRVLVVLNHENHRQLAVRRGVQRLPELAFAGRAVPQRDIGHLIGLEADVLKLAII